MHKMGLRNQIKRYSPCKVNIIMGKETDELQHCDIRITKMETNFWKKLHTPNTWIYSTVKEEEITVGCTHKMYSTDTINGTRIRGEIVSLTLHRENLDTDKLWENTNQTNGSPLTGKERWTEIILHNREDIKKQRSSETGMLTRIKRITI
jgi:hypothetical protein